MVKQKTQNARVDKARWAAYAAAGVAATLAGTQSAEASIIHEVVGSPGGDFSDGNSVNLSLPGSLSLNFLNPAGGEDAAALSVNGGSVAGFSIYAVNDMDGVNISTKRFLPATQNGSMVNPNPGASYSSTVAARFNSQFGGAFQATRLGDTMGGGIVSFRFGGDGMGGAGTQYGWVRLTFDAAAGTNNFVIEEYAYGMADEAVLTGQTVSAIPEPTSLGLLALGAFGVVANRRRRKLVA